MNKFFEITNIIFEILKGTPWWVYVLLLYVVIRGIIALKTRIVSINKIFILPAIFMGMRVYNFISGKDYAFIHISAWVAVLLIGAVIGWFAFENIKIKADKKHSLIEIPGTKFTLIFILLFFSIKYYFGYTMITSVDLQQKMFFFMIDLISSGIITGLFLGRSLGFLYKYKRVK